MDPQIATALIEMGTSLGGMVLSGTATQVNAKIKSLKDVKDADKLRAEYDELINKLLAERAEALRIAQTYQSELERYQISDEDIEHLHKTVETVLDILKGNGQGAAVATFEQFKALISVDTLKAMQLLGFNYKAAIGEPLTQICANAILGLGKTTPPANGRKK